MARYISKLYLLMWKNYTIQKRHPIQTAIEIAAPLVCAVILVTVRVLSDFEVNTKHSIFPPFSPSEINGTVVQNISYIGSILYSPSSPVLDKIMRRSASKLKLRVRSVTSEAELIKTFLTMSDMQRLVTLVGVVFEDNLLGATSLTNEINIKLRFPSELRSKIITLFPGSWNTYTLFPLYKVPGPRGGMNPEGGYVPGYYSEGFLAIQNAISVTLIQHLMPNIELPEIYLRRHPYPPHTRYLLLQSLQSSMPLAIWLSMAYTCVNIVRLVTVEKESQIKEAMKIMGLPSILNWIAWFLHCFSLMVIAVVIIVIMLKISWGHQTDIRVLPQTNWSVLLVFLLLYAVSTICFCFLLSVLFDNANVAATATGLAWFVSFVPFMLMQDKYDRLSFYSKIGVSVFSNTAMGFGCFIMVQYEGTGEGIGWNSIWEGATAEDKLSVGHMIVMTVFDGILYLLIAVYIDAVFPGQYGIPKPWYFVVTLFFTHKRKHEYFINPLSTKNHKYDKRNFEEELNLNIGVQTCNLTKEFGDAVAVKNLNINMFEDQITVLLGHNGAGKSTLINMIVGILQPTKGTALVGGYDIRANIEKIRQNLGFCPQNNILFSELTVAEHIYFFSMMKRGDKSKVNEEIRKYVKMLRFEDKLNEQSRFLSGGMNRRLCAAIALCGESSVVVFDEPTSGMDPSARRNFWEFIKSQKEGRTILLTTHSMDEADFLGDRICIMVSGELQCCGSPLFLKERFGAGYYLVIAKDDKYETNKVTELLHDYIPNVCVYKESDSEVIYQLNEKDTKVFGPMLLSLEENNRNLNIKSFGVTLTTMEDVFLKVGSKFVEQEFKNTLTLSGISMEDEKDENNIFRTHCAIRSGFITDFKLIISQFRAMFLKNVLYTRYTYVLYVLQIFLPVFVFIIAEMVMKRRDVQHNLQLTLEKYFETYTLVEYVGNLSEIYLYFKNYKSSIKHGLTDITWNSYNNDGILDYLILFSENKKNLKIYTQSYIVGASYVYTGNKSSITGWFNNQAYHSPPLSLNLIYNSLLHSSNHSLRFSNHPLPLTQKSEAMRQNNPAGNITFQIAFNIAFSMSFIAAYYIIFPVKEHVSKSKHLQFVSGVKTFIYWSVMYVWDTATFLLIAVALLVTMAAYKETGFSTFEQLNQTLILLLMFMLATLLIAYNLSFIFHNALVAFTKILLFNLIIGLGMYLMVSLLKIPLLNLANISETLDWVFLTIMPIYSIASSFENLRKNVIILEACEPVMFLCNITKHSCCRKPELCPKNNCVPVTDNIFDWDVPGIGRNILFFSIIMIVSIILLCLIELKAFETLRYIIIKVFKGNLIVETAKENESDVQSEVEMIKNTNLETLNNTFRIVMIDLTKYFGKILAVDRLCAAVKTGECFGLLGINGAGKTSTFRMLTGDISISSGDAYICGIDLKKNMRVAQKLIGYCPQFDAMIEVLTGRQILRIYCLLRGLDVSNIAHEIIRLSEEMLLTKYLDKSIKTYSGGNRRKLSTALALIGDPPILLLDEPTSGMDPVSKRYVWNLICKLRDRGKCIIVTSHSMEECEILCTRIAIMVNGRFVCLGSAQHLKTKFAEGFTITIKVKSLNTEILNKISEFIGSKFRGATIEEQCGSLLSFYVPSTNIKWSKIFTTMESAKDQLEVESYSVRQTSLEQVFLLFTRHQRSSLSEY